MEAFSGEQADAIELEPDAIHDQYIGLGFLRLPGPAAEEYGLLIWAPEGVRYPCFEFGYLLSLTA